MGISRDRFPGLLWARSASGDSQGPRAQGRPPAGGLRGPGAQGAQGPRGPRGPVAQGVWPQHSVVWPQHSVVWPQHSSVWFQHNSSLLTGNSSLATGNRNPGKRGIGHERGRPTTKRAETDIYESPAPQERPRHLPAPQNPKNPRKSGFFGPRAPGPPPRAPIPTLHLRCGLACKGPLH